MKISLLLFLSVFAQVAFCLVPPSDPNIQYFGRWDLSNPKIAEADWPGVYLKVVFEGTGISVALEGQNVFEAMIDGSSSAILGVTDSLKTFSVASGLEPGRHTLILNKRSESQTSSTRFFGLDLPSGTKLLAPPARPQRRIEFIGDSYTVGYGMESPSREPGNLSEDSLLLWTTNTPQSFGALIAKGTGAEYQINAFSGRGLARNINGMEPKKTFGYFYGCTLMSGCNTTGKSPRWDFNSWHPQVIIIGLGINDFQGNAPYADSTAFDMAYTKLLDSLRIKHQGVKFILCATKVWPTEALVPRVQSIVAKEQAKGRQDISYYEYVSENTGLWFHPNLMDHQNIARTLRPLVAKAGGWMSR
jgi:lysophospholipase L1-like esterase